MSTPPTTCDKIKEVHTWSKEEKQALRSLSVWCLKEWPSLIYAFSEISPAIANKLETEDFDWKILMGYEKSAAEACTKGSMLEAAVCLAEKLAYYAEHCGVGQDNQNYKQMLTELSDYRSRLAAQV